MQEILKEKNHVWLKDHPYHHTKQDGLFTTPNGSQAVYKMTLRKNQDDFEHISPYYYLETSIVKDMQNNYESKGLKMAYIIAWNVAVRMYSYMIFDIGKYLDKYNGDPPTERKLFPARTWGGDGTMEWKLCFRFDTFDIVKEGTVSIPIEKKGSNKKRPIWKPINKK